MTQKPALASFGFILIPVALGLFAASLIIPWVTITFLGTFPFSPVTIASELYAHGTAVVQSPQNATAAESPVLSNQSFDLLRFISAYRTSFSAFVISFVLYLAAFACIISATVKKSQRPIISVSAGILAIASGMLCLGSLELLKINFAEVAAASGGIIGGEFKGSEGSIAESIIHIGSGPYLILIIGALSISYYFVERTKMQKEEASL